MDTTTFLIIFEDLLKERFDYLCKKYNISNITLNLSNNYTSNILLNILYRIKSKKRLHNEYKCLKKKIVQNNIKKILVSNSEGYIASNFLTKLREDFPWIEIVSLQHGLFVPEYRPLKEKIKRLVNVITYKIYHLKLFGEGFGNKLPDRYIVLNNLYREYLLKLGWNSKDIIVDPYFLKCYFYDMGKKYNKAKENNETALFFTQALSYSRLCSKEQETTLNKRIIAYLSSNYKKVIIKIHPSKKPLLTFPLPDNCCIEADILEALKQADVAYSFFSTALIDAEIFGINTVAIKSKYIKISDKIYQLFRNCIDLDEIVSDVKEK